MYYWLENINSKYRLAIFVKIPSDISNYGPTFIIWANFIGSIPSFPMGQPNGSLKSELSAFGPIKQ